MKLNLEKMYQEEYFSDRNGGDRLRIESYKNEYNNITRFIQRGRVLDVGCGTGEFLELFDQSDWSKFGIEISAYASKIAEKKSIQMIDFYNTEHKFDLIVLRGVFQHLEFPVYYLEKLINMLNSGGYVVILATPNTNSLYYKLFGDLPMLDSSRNFVVPSDKMLSNILKNMGCRVEKISFPYLTSPYSNLVRDHFYFFLSLLGFRPKFPFWRNMMEIYAKKE